MGERVDPAEARYAASVAEMDVRGEFEPRATGVCGRCGAKPMTQLRYPKHIGRGEVKVEVAMTCRVCRVDNVKRWGAMMEASAARGRELRGDASTLRPTALVLRDAGLVSYDEEQGSWNLTDSGEELLRWADGCVT